MLGAVLLILSSLVILFVGGWVFLDNSLYRDQEEKDSAAQVFLASRDFNNKEI